MNDSSTLEQIDSRLKAIDISREAHNNAGHAGAWLDSLPPELKQWSGRTKFFEEILSKLASVTLSSQSNKKILSRATNLHRRANKTEQTLNVVVNNLEVPPDEADKAIRYVTEDEQLKWSPLIRKGLVNLAIHGSDFKKVRRLAWLQLCRQYSQKPQLTKLREVQRPVFVHAGSRVTFEREDLRGIRKSFIRERRTLGPRGTVTDAAEVPNAGKDIVPILLAALANPVGVERKEAALTLGEIGGGEVATLLADALRSEIEERGVDEDYQVYLTSSLSNLGGPDAVEGLLRAAEQGSERVRLAALSGLESLATAGAVALTEYPEPATIDSDEMRDAYVRLAGRLSAIISAQATPAYVRHKARELLDTVRISLNTG